MAARLGLHTHAGIVRTLAACTTAPAVCLVYELMEGGSLWDALHARHQRPRYGMLLAVLEDVAAALAHAHSAGLAAHGDLCTRNLLLDADERVRVGDWGLAQLKGGPATHVRSAGVGPGASCTGVLAHWRTRAQLTLFRLLHCVQGVVGSAPFAAPELFDQAAASEWSDVWSFGVVTWELLTGQEAWAGMSPLQIALVVGVDRRRLPILPGCPPPLARLLKACWRSVPDQRPAFSTILGAVRALRMRQQASAADRPSSRRAAPAVPYKTRDTLLAALPQARRAAVWQVAESTA